MVKIVFSVKSLLIVVVVMVLIGVGVYAYGTSSPATFGHTLGEFTPPQYCGFYNGGWLRYDGAKWVCENTPSGGSGVSTPVTCTGINKVLQWSGSTWLCANVAI